MLPPQGVQTRHQLHRAVSYTVNLLGNALPELDLHVAGLIGRHLQGARQLEQALLGLPPGVLQRSTLVAQVPQVAVTAVNLRLRGRHRDTVLGGVAQRILPSPDLPFAPGGDDLELGVEGLVGQLKADLIVALAGASMGHSIGTLQLSDLHLTPGDDRAGEGRAQQVLALVDSACLQRGEDILGDELLAQVLYVDFAGPAGQSFLLQALQFLALTDVG